MLCFFQESKPGISLPLLNYAYNFLYYSLTLNNIAALIQLIFMNSRAFFMLNSELIKFAYELNRIIKISVNEKRNQNFLVTLKKISDNIVILQNFVC